LLDDFEAFKNPVPEMIENTVEMARQLELEVDPQDVAELMESHSQPFNNEDLLALEGQRQEEDVPEEVSIVEPKGLTFKISLKFSVISKLAWLFWKSMIWILKEV
jgi:aspartate carbamoyltransferase regulatory subunit